MDDRILKFTLKLSTLPVITLHIEDKDIVIYHCKHHGSRLSVGSETKKLPVQLPENV